MSRLLLTRKCSIPGTAGITENLSISIDKYGFASVLKRDSFVKLILEVVESVVVVVVLLVVVVVLTVVVLGVVLTLMGFWRFREFSGQAGLVLSCLLVCNV